MKHSKQYAVILSLLLCFALLLGCGATQTETPDPNGPSQTEPQTPDVESTDPVEETEPTVPETDDPVEETEEPEEPVEEESEEPVAQEHPMQLLPLNDKVELTDPMADGTYHVAFQAEDIMNVGDTFFLTAEFFDYDRYDAAMVEQLQVGDTIQVCGEMVTVDSVDFMQDSGTGDTYVVYINGGIDYDGINLLANAEKTVYRTVTWNDFPLYYSVGEMGCVISHDIVLKDQKDDPSATPVEADFQALPGWVTDAVNGYFVQFSTTLTMENGEAIMIDRVYTP